MDAQESPFRVSLSWGLPWSPDVSGRSAGARSLLALGRGRLPQNNSPQGREPGPAGLTQQQAEPSLKVRGRDNSKEKQHLSLSSVFRLQSDPMERKGP